MLVAVYEQRNHPLTEAMNAMQMMSRLNILALSGAILGWSMLLTGCGAEGDPETESLVSLAEVESAQEVLAEADEKAGGCLVELAQCFADDGQDCMASFTYIIPFNVLNITNK